MNNILFLTSAELNVFHKLPETLREGWVTSEQGSLEEETAEQLELRIKMAVFDDPALQSLTQKLKKALTTQSLEKAVSSIDLSALAPEQLAELFFVLGIRVLNSMITVLLNRSSTDEDMEGLAGLTRIRSMLSEANSSNS